MSSRMSQEYEKKAFLCSGKQKNRMIGVYHSIFCSRDVVNISILFFANVANKINGVWENKH